MRDRDRADAIAALKSVAAMYDDLGELAGIWLAIAALRPADASLSRVLSREEYLARMRGHCLTGIS